MKTTVYVCLLCVELLKVFGCCGHVGRRLSSPYKGQGSPGRTRAGPARTDFALTGTCLSGALYWVDGSWSRSSNRGRTILSGHLTRVRHGGSTTTESILLRLSTPTGSRFLLTDGVRSTVEKPGPGSCRSYESS